jgi:nitrate/nitrite transporter NarK
MLRYRLLAVNVAGVASARLAPMGATTGGRLTRVRSRARRRSLFATVLATIMAYSTFSQFAFGVLAGFLIDEFSITRSELGFLTTGLFFVGGIGSPYAGMLVDRFGARRMAISSAVMVALSFLAMAGAPSYPWMLVAATCAGGALASCNPITNKLVALHISAGERGLTMGVKQAGVQVGAFVIGLMLPALASSQGWRTAIGVLALVPVLAVACIAWLIPADETTERANSPRPARRRLEAAVWWMMGYAFLMGAGVAGFSAYLPLYIEEDLGHSVSTAGAVVGAIGLVGILARVALGWVSERLGRFALSLVVMGVGSVGATLLILGARPDNTWILWVAAALFGISAITWNTVGMIAVLSEVGDEDAGRASGYVQSGFYGGFAVSPILFGYSVDTTGEYTIGWIGVTAAFIAATLVATLWHRSSAERP